MSTLAQYEFCFASGVALTNIWTLYLEGIYSGSMHLIF